MTPIEFINKYDIASAKKLSSLRVINDIIADQYYVIKINGTDIIIDMKAEEWSPQTLEYKINEVGLMYEEVCLHKAHKESFETLDEFMYYVRLAEGGISYDINNLINYPFKKGFLLTYGDIVNQLNLYINDIFMKGCRSLFQLLISEYIKGYAYFDEPSVKMWGGELSYEYVAFSYRPYI